LSLVFQALYMTHAWQALT